MTELKRCPLCDSKPYVDYTKTELDGLIEGYTINIGCMRDGVNVRAVSLYDMESAYEKGYEKME